VFGGDAVDDQGVPVVEVGGEVVEEDHRHAGIDAELAVDESGATDGDGLRRRVLVGGAIPTCGCCVQVACGVVPGVSFACHDFLL
jgi:hypothetical protein